MSVLYVYAVLAPVPASPGQACGVDGERLEMLDVASLTVAVGRMSAVPEPTIARLRRHDAAIRSLAGAGAALVPMRYGQALPDQGALATAIERAADGLRAALARVAGNEQMTLRVDCAENEGEGDPVPPKDGAAPAGAGTRYLRERLRQRALERTAPPIVAPLLERLAPLVREQRIERARRPRPHARIYHLVRIDDRQVYRARLCAALRERPDLRLSVSGPWVPYAFVGAEPLRGPDREHAP